MTDEGLERLASDEGRRVKPYLDSVGVWTIGIGRNLEDVGFSDNEVELLADYFGGYREAVNGIFRVGLTDDIIEYMFRRDVERAERDLDARFPFWRDVTPDARRDVIVNMCFNLGLTRFAHFTKFWHAIRARDYPRAAVEMLDSRWARQVGPRSERLADVMDPDRRNR